MTESTTYRAWAETLTADRLAADLDRLSTDVRAFTGDQRAALLHEAALRMKANNPRLEPVRHTLSKAQAAHVEFYNSSGVPVKWFVGPEMDDGSVEVIGLGVFDAADPRKPERSFVWSLLINHDGSECHTSEAVIEDGFETGINF